MCHVPDDSIQLQHKHNSIDHILITHSFSVIYCEIIINKPHTQSARSRSLSLSLLLYLPISPSVSVTVQLTD